MGIENELYFDNYNNTIAVKTDSSDLFHQWFYMIKVRDDTIASNNYFLYPVIFSSFAIRKSEKVQIVNGFNEAVHLYAFGKNADQIQLGGHILASTIFNYSFVNTDWALINPYQSVLRAFAAAKHGLKAKISGPGGVLLTGVATDFNMSMNGAINSVVDFSMTFVSADSVVSIGSLPNVPEVPKTGKWNILI